MPEIAGSEVERRRAERLPVRIRARVHSLTVNTEVEVRDLSRHGLLLACQAPLGPTGTTVDVLVTLNENPVRLVGEVVRTSDPTLGCLAGIRFCGLSPKVRLALANYMIEHHYQARA